MSGDALNIEALSGEMDRMFNLGRNEGSIPGLPLGELFDYPEDIVDIDVDKETQMSSAIKSYKRYVDDTYVNVQGGIREVVHGILAIGFMFPKGLTVNIVLNIWRIEFLDVFCWKNLLSRIMSTTVKRNFSFPFGHVQKDSDHPRMYKLCGLLGEMLRGRRISSDEEIYRKSDECTALEFQSIGYSRREVMEAMKLAGDKIENNYSQMFVKKEDEDRNNFVYYGGSMVYNGTYKYQEVVENFLKYCKPVWAPKILMVPGQKLKGLAYTKKQYLKRQNEDAGESKLGKK